MKTLYLFIDESGQFDFSPNGSKYFILTCLSTQTPIETGSPLLNLRYELLPNYSCGSSVEEQGYFHASEDSQDVRDNVFSVISKIRFQIRVDSIIAQKNRAAPKFYKQPLEFYRLIGEPLLKYAFTRATWKNYDHVVIMFSSIFDKKKRGILKQAFKSLIKQHAKVSFALYFHDSKCDPCNQVADYIAWAIYRKWESSDSRSYVLIKHLVNTEFPIFQRGHTEYYVYK